MRTISKEAGNEKVKQFKGDLYQRRTTRETPPKSDWVMQVEQFANKDKKAEIIKAWTEIKEHPEAQDMSSDVGSAFDKEDLDQEMRAVYDVLDDGGFIYASFEHSFWIKVKKQGKLVRVM